MTTCVGVTKSVESGREGCESWELLSTWVGAREGREASITSPPPWLLRGWETNGGRGWMGEQAREGACAAA